MPALPCPPAPKIGAVTLIQRFGSALNLNPHLHMLFLDGARTFIGSKVTFHRARQPNPTQPDEVAKLLDNMSRHILTLIERREALPERAACAAEIDFGRNKPGDVLQRWYRDNGSWQDCGQRGKPVSQPFYIELLSPGGYRLRSK